MAAPRVRPLEKLYIDQPNFVGGLQIIAKGYIGLTRVASPLDRRLFALTTK